MRKKCDPEMLKKMRKMLPDYCFYFVVNYFLTETIITTMLLSYYYNTIAKNAKFGSLRNANKTQKMLPSYCFYLAINRVLKRNYNTVESIELL